MFVDYATSCVANFSDCMFYLFNAGYLAIYGTMYGRGIAKTLRIANNIYPTEAIHQRIVVYCIAVIITPWQ